MKPRRIPAETNSELLHHRVTLTCVGNLEVPRGGGKRLMKLKLSLQLKKKKKIQIPCKEVNCYQEALANAQAREDVESY